MMHTEKIRRFCLLAMGGLFALALSGCEGPDGPSASSEDAPGKPNILLIVSEDNGPHLGSYGDPQALTPNLDQLAADGVRFARAFVTYSVCSPSRSTILTGLYPHQNGQVGLATHKFAMREGVATLPGLLKQQDYRTGIIGKLHVNPASAFPFDLNWNDPDYISFQRRDVREVARQAEAFITASDQPFFLMVNYPDAHFPVLRQQNGIPEMPLEATNVVTWPFVGVDNERIRGYVADYYNCMSRMDTGVGLLLEKLAASGKAHNTLLIYLGDHGPQFSRGKTTNYEAGLQIPLIVRWPGRVNTGEVRGEFVSTIDLVPTILAAIGQDGPAGLPGESLLPLLRGDDMPWRDYLFADGDGGAPPLYFPQRSVRDARYKLIVNLLQDRDNILAERYAFHIGAFFEAGTTPEEVATAGEDVQRAYQTWLEAPPVELYDLETDPHEFNNLAADPVYADIRERLMDALKDWQQRTEDPLADPEKLRLFTEEVDQARATYPNNGYQRDPDFAWRYHDYFYPASR